MLPFYFYNITVIVIILDSYLACRINSSVDIDMPLLQQINNLKCVNLTPQIGIYYTEFTSATVENMDTVAPFFFIYKYN